MCYASSKMAEESFCMVLAGTNRVEGTQSTQFVFLGEEKGGGGGGLFQKMWFLREGLIELLW